MPGLPLADWAVATDGQVTDVFWPILVPHVDGLVADRNPVKRKVSPEESTRWIGATLRLGRCTPGLSLAMAESSQLVIEPVYIPSRTAPLSLRFLTPGTL